MDISQGAQVLIVEEENKFHLVVSAIKKIKQDIRIKEIYILGRSWEGIRDNLVRENISEDMTFEWYLVTDLNDQTPIV